MATDYANAPIWGSEYQKALAAGNTALANRYKQIIDAAPQRSAQAGLIGAQMVDMGRGNQNVSSPIQENGLEYNILGQSRVPVPATVNNIDGTHTGQFNNWQSTPTNSTLPQTERAAATPTPLPVETTGTSPDPKAQSPIAKATFEANSGPQTSQFPAYTGNTSTGSSTGIIGSSPTGAPATAGITPWTVTSPQTVQGQLSGLLDKNNPLNQTVTTLAKQQMNDRGLINSSIAESAGLSALLNNAIQIANPDATTYGQAAQSNANAANQASLSNAQMANQKSISDATLANQVTLAKLNASTQKELAALEARYKTAAQTSASATAMWQTAMNNLTNIMSDPNLDAASKQQSINNIINSLATGIKISGKIGGIDFGNLLQFD